MSSKALLWLIYTELLMTVREPGAMFMSIILPLAVFLALGFSVGGTEIEVSKDSGVVDLFHVRGRPSGGQHRLGDRRLRHRRFAAGSGGAPAIRGVPALPGHADAVFGAHSCSAGSGSRPS